MLVCSACTINIRLFVFQLKKNVVILPKQNKYFATKRELLLKHIKEKTP